MFPLSSTINESKYPLHAGFVISFLASLPPGIVNVLTIQLAIAENYIVASWFALGSVAAEITCVKICVVLMNRAFKFELITRIFQWLVLIVLITLSVMSFVASVEGTVQGTDNPIRYDMSPFVFGFLTMAINPGLVPFWLGWTTILFDRKILKSNESDLGYLAGIGLGSVVASGIFVGCGHFLFSTFIIKERTLHFIFGCVFSIMTFLYAGKLLRLRYNRGKGT